MNSKRSGISSLAVVLALVALAAVVGYGVTQRGWFSPPKTEKVEGQSVQRGPLRISVIERGNLKAADAVSIKNELEGNSTILFLVAEGTVVEKGQLLCELDASQLTDKRLAQEISLRNADAAFVKSQKNYEIQKSQNDSDIKKAEQKLLFSEKDLEKFEAAQGERTNQLAKADEQITLAEEQHKQAESKLNWSKQLYEKGFLTKTELDADDLAMKRAGIQLDAATREKQLLDKYQLERTKIELQSGLEEGKRELDRVQLQALARIVDFESDMRTKEAQFKLEQEKLEKLENQIAKAKIIAPRNGMVVYAQQEQNRMGQSTPIQEGSQVRERQEILTIPNASGMIAQASVHESQLKQVAVGQACVVKIDAVGAKEFHGRVSYVAVLPDQNSYWSNPNTRLYRADVQILDGTLEMRPGMSCLIEILVDDIADTLYVPAQSVYRSGGDNIVFVAKAASHEERKVKVGRYNRLWVEVTEGVKEGETVLLNPPSDFVAQAVPPTEQGASAPTGMPATGIPPSGLPSTMPGGASEGAKGGAMLEAGKAPSTDAAPGAKAGESEASGERSGRNANMSEEERAKMRERFQNMTEEERAKLREQFQGGGGAPGGGQGGGRRGSRSGEGGGADNGGDGSKSGG